MSILFDVCLYLLVGLDVQCLCLVTVYWQVALCQRKQFTTLLQRAAPWLQGRRFELRNLWEITPKNKWKWWRCGWFFVCVFGVLACLRQIGSEYDYGPSIYTVNDQYIKPVTAEAGKMSWALMMHPLGLDCDLLLGRLEELHMTQCLPKVPLSFSLCWHCITYYLSSLFIMSYYVRYELEQRSVVGPMMWCSHPDPSCRGSVCK